MENSSVASASSEAGSSRSQEIEELERFIDSYVLEYQVQGLLGDKADGELDGDNDSKVPQWAEECNDKKDGSWSSSRGRGSFKPDEWEHSSNGSTGSRPSSGSRPGSCSRSGSRGRNNQVKCPAKNGNRDGSFDILGTDIWAANTVDSHGGAGWEVQPEKLDFSQFHRKHYRGTPKHLPHIDREGVMKSQLEEDGGIDMNDMERVLPHLHAAFPPLPNEAEIAHTKKLFRRRRSDRRPRGELSRDLITVVLPTGPGGERQVSARRQQRILGGGGGGGGGGGVGKSQNQNHLQQQSPHHQRELLHQPPPGQEHLGESRNSVGARFPRQHQGRQPHHGYSQNRRWHYGQRSQGHGHASPVASDRGVARSGKETESEKVSEFFPSHQSPPEPKGSANSLTQSGSPSANQNACSGQTSNQEPPGPPQSEAVIEGLLEQPKVSLLQSSKERLRRRLKDKEEVCEVPGGGGGQRMSRLVELLNSMRSNSSGAKQQLASFMEEAQASARCEESLARVVGTIYSKAVSDRSFAPTAAKLCDKMALFMVEGTKFRSLLLNMLQRDFACRKDLHQSDVEQWLGFITFLCEVFSTMRSSSGEPYRVLVMPIYTCLGELLESIDVKEDAVLCCSMELQSTGYLLEAQLPAMMTELLAAVRDKMLRPAESQLTRSLLMEVIELHAHHWTPLEALTTQYYNRTIQKLTTTA